MCIADVTRSQVFAGFRLHEIAGEDRILIRIARAILVNRMLLRNPELGPETPRGIRFAQIAANERRRAAGEDETGLWEAPC